MGVTNETSKNCQHFRPQIERLAAEPGARLSTALARHVETCAECRTLLDGIMAVQYSLDRAKWRTMPVDTLALCNRQAMKKLEQWVRQTAKARELAVAKPDLPRWQQLTIHLGRSGIGIAAGLAVLAANGVVNGGLSLTQDRLERLGEIHQRHHIGNYSDSGGEMA